MTITEQCDCCEKPSGALIPNAADDGETRCCPECVKALWLCPRCGYVANWVLRGDSWVCNGPNGCGLKT